MRCADYLGPFCQGIFVVRFVVRFIVPQIVPQIVQKPPQKRGTISEVFARFFARFENTPPDTMSWVMIEKNSQSLPDS